MDYEIFTPSNSDWNQISFFYEYSPTKYMDLGDGHEVELLKRGYNMTSYKYTTPKNVFFIRVDYPNEEVAIKCVDRIGDDDHTEYGNKQDIYYAAQSLANKLEDYYNGIY